MSRASRICDQGTCELPTGQMNGAAMTDVDAIVRVADEEIRATADTAAGTAVVAAANRAMLDEVAAWRAECRRRVGQAVYPNWRSRPRRDDGADRAEQVLAERRRREAARPIGPEPRTQMADIDMAALVAAVRNVSVADYSPTRPPRWYRRLLNMFRNNQSDQEE